MPVSSTALLNRFQGRRPNPIALFLGSFLMDLGNRLADNSERQRLQREKEQAEAQQRQQDFQAESSQLQQGAELAESPEQLNALMARADTGPMGAPMFSGAVSAGMPVLGPRPERQQLQKRVEGRQEQLSEEQRRNIFEQARQMIEGGESTGVALERVGQPEGGAEGFGSMSQQQIGRLAQVEGSRKTQEREGEQEAAVAEQQSMEDRELINEGRRLGIEINELNLAEARKRAGQTDATGQDMLRALALTATGLQKFGAAVAMKAARGEEITEADLPDEAAQQLLALAVRFLPDIIEAESTFSQDFVLGPEQFEQALQMASGMLEAARAFTGGR